MKKKYVIELCAVCIIALFTFSAIAIIKSFAFSLNDIKYKQLGANVKSVVMENNEDIVAYINNEPILKKDYEACKITRYFARDENLRIIEEQKDKIPKDKYDTLIKNLNSITDESIFEEMIQDMVIFQEAKKLNLTVTDKEVDDYLKQFDSIDSSDVEGTNMMNNISAYKEGLGFSEKENNEKEKKAIIEFLLKSKLNQYYLDNAPDDVKKTSSASNNYCKEKIIELRKVAIVKKVNQENSVRSNSSISK